MQCGGIHCGCGKGQRERVHAGGLVGSQEVRPPGFPLSRGWRLKGESLFCVSVSDRAPLFLTERSSMLLLSCDPSWLTYMKIIGQGSVRMVVVKVEVEDSFAPLRRGICCGISRTLSVIFERLCIER